MAEPSELTARGSQSMPGLEVPEKIVLYRLAKRVFFNDFGTYRNAGLR